jgi:hypothetical protein
MESTEGTFKPATKTFKILFHAFNITTATINNKVNTLRQEKLEFFLPLEKFDPLYDPDTMGEEEVLSLELPYSNEAISIQLNS